MNSDTRHRLDFHRYVYFRRFDVTMARHPLETRSMRGEIDKLGDGRLQRARPCSTENKEQQIWNKEPEIDMRGVELVVNKKRESDQIEDDRRRHQSAPESDAREAISTSVIFGHGLQHNTPPEVPVDLNVPIVPARIGGIAPAFFLEHV